MTANNVVFAIESPQHYLNPEFSNNLDRFGEAVKSLGINYAYIPRNIINNFYDIPEYCVVGDPIVIAYGSIQFVRGLKIPHFAYGWSGTDWASTSAHIPRHILINSDYNITTWSDLKLNFLWWMERFDSIGLFVRPVSDKKTFAGTTIPRTNYDNYMRALEQTSSVLPETLCVISSIKHLVAEYRFWVVDREIVSSSEAYGPSSFFVPVANVVPDHIYKFATTITKLDWQPDSCYTLDVGVMKDGSLGVMELNSFCTAGFYDADLVPIVKAVVRQAIRDHNP